MHPAIRVSGLSKLYHVGARQQGYKTLRESIADAFWAPLKRLRSQGTGVRGQESGARLSGENFWALKDVSFEVQPGEVVGIIGRNGAGKSTLLKILSRITEPTSGRIELRGRVGSLLEVGTGFHPELTGRENIYMNGSILGMSRREIAHKFDEIVAFAEVEDFLDTPVKRYSSGMYVRLAFAVAAHLEPEILIVDEVLAVGDQAFQKKCIRKMDQVRVSGRTVLVVSHNLGTLASLCTSGVVLDGGRIATSGRISQVLHAYQRMQRDVSSNTLDKHSRGSAMPCIDSVSIVDEDDEHVSAINLGGALRCKVVIADIGMLREPMIGLGINSASGERALTLLSPINESRLPALQGQCSVLCEVHRLPLAPGDYSVKVSLSSGRDELDAIETACTFTVVDHDSFDTGWHFHKGWCIAEADWAVKSE